MRTIKIASPELTEFRMNIVDEVNYHNKQCGDKFMTPKYSKMLSYELLLKYFTDLVNKNVYLCYPYNKETKRDPINVMLIKPEEVFATGKVIGLTKKEAIFEFRPVKNISKEEFSRYKIHLEEPIIQATLNGVYLKYARIVFEKR